VRPRDAASLILLENGSGECRVLVGRRPPGSRFMPNLYVFPGGAVEASDSRPRPASGLKSAIASQLAVGGDPGRARSLAMAAVRETFEETGLLLGAPGDVGPVHSMRFHARFFAADARYLRGALSGDTELEDLHWRPVDDALALPMADVQHFMLEHAVRAMSPGDEPTSAKPLFTYRAGQRYIRYIKPRL
jgi:8-oxo-dGTP pyrophosphatase MutT (NUDIX family)